MSIDHSQTNVRNPIQQEVAYSWAIKDPIKYGLRLAEDLASSCI